MRSRRSTPLALALLAGALAGCAVGPDYTPPALRQTPESFAEVGQGGTTPDAPDRALLTRWWTVFRDPALDSLIARAVASNLDLRIAEARVREARAQRGVVAADGLPQVDAFGDYRRERRSENGSGVGFSGANQDADLFQAGFDASWEIDVFGRVRRGVEAADADIDAAVENRRDALVSLLSEVARNYVETRTFQRRLALTRDNLRLQHDGTELSRARFKAGLTSELDVKQAENLEATTAAQIPLLETGLRQAIHRLGVLLGREPGALLGELAQPGPIPERPPSVAVGLPSDLLRRRPDVRRSERLLAAATARVGVATADLYPRFSLTGTFGFQSQQAGELFDAGSRFWSFGPSVRWPIFEAGRIRSNIRVQDARVDAALAAFEKSVLSAFEDVENSLVAYSQEQTRRESLASALGAARRALELSQELYQRGVTGYLNVLDAQRAALAAEDSLAQSDRSLAASLIALYKALGGGWEEVDEAAQNTPPEPAPAATPGE